MANSDQQAHTGTEQEQTGVDEAQLYQRYPTLKTISEVSAEEQVKAYQAVLSDLQERLHAEQ